MIPYMQLSSTFPRQSNGCGTHGVRPSAVCDSKLSCRLRPGNVMSCFDPSIFCSPPGYMSNSSYYLLAFGIREMARRSVTRPRKLASQTRSRATVDAMIEATARILVRDGFDKASTNRIAEKAGVSVGSLYQYFPSKEALVAAVIDRHNQEIMRTVRGELAEAMGLPVEKAIRKLVAVSVKAHRINPKLHRV